MKRDDCFELGIVTKPHGTKGEAILFLDTDYPEDYVDLESVFLEMRGGLVPYFIESLHLNRSDKAIVKFEEIESIEDVETIQGAKVFLPLALLPKLEGGQFYYHQVVGYMVEDENLGVLGEVVSFSETAAQPIMVMDYKEREVLIPMSENIVLRADHENNKMITCLPGGLLELYLED